MYTRSKARELREYGWKVSHAKCDHQHPIGPTPGQHVRLRKGATRELVGEWDALITRVRGLPEDPTLFVVPGRVVPLADRVGVAPLPSGLTLGRHSRYYMQAEPCVESDIWRRFQPVCMGQARWEMAFARLVPVAEAENYPMARFIQRIPGMLDLAMNGKPLLLVEPEDAETLLTDCLLLYPVD
jgi:hypothetical protein